MAERWIEETFHRHWRVALKADEVLYEIKTDHQHLVIFTNATWGTVLMLDGVCQLTTSDEFVYHEMMAHVPLMMLEKPKRVLVVGGGDGGVLREVLKHPSVTKATLCEIDRTVVDTALRYFPEVPGKVFDDPRADLVIGDGLEYVAKTAEKFDCIIVDSSEPIGPSAVLHTPAFFADCRRALADGGILVTQNGLPFLFPEHLAGTTQVFASMFKRVAPYLCTQPCYFGGPFALNLATDTPSLTMVDIKTLAKRLKKRRIADLRYWTPAVHAGAFALPRHLEGVVTAAVVAGRSGEAATDSAGKRPKMAKAKIAAKRAVKDKAKNKVSNKKPAR